MNEPDQIPESSIVQETAAPAPASEPSVSPQAAGSPLVALTAVSPLIALFFGALPGLNVVPPLICWLVWKGDYPLLDQVGKNILNAQISWAIYLLVSLVVCGVLTFIFIGFLLIWIIPLAWVILTIINAVKVSNGDYKYQVPFTITFIK